MANKETLKQAGYTFVKKSDSGYVLKDEDGKLELFVHNPNHASWGIKDTIGGKAVDLEYVRSFKESLDESEGNGYIGFYGGKKVEVYAETSYKAQLKATDEFQKMFPRKKVKSYDVTVKLAEKDGKQVTTHSESLEEGFKDTPESLKIEKEIRKLRQELASANDDNSDGITKKIGELKKKLLKSRVKVDTDKHWMYAAESKEPVTGKGKWTTKVGKNKNTFDVYLNGKYQYNIGAETSARAITLAKQQYKEIYKNPTVMDSNIAHCLTILEGGIPNSSGIRDALDKVITGDADLTDRERLTLLKYKLIGDNGKPTQLAKEQFSELFD